MSQHEIHIHNLQIEKVMGISVKCLHFYNKHSPTMAMSSANFQKLELSPHLALNFRKSHQIKFRVSNLTTSKVIGKRPPGW